MELRPGNAALCDASCAWVMGLCEFYGRLKQCVEAVLNRVLNTGSCCEPGHLHAHACRYFCDCIFSLPRKCCPQQQRFFFNPKSAKAVETAEIGSSRWWLCVLYLGQTPQKDIHSQTSNNNCQAQIEVMMSPFLKISVSHMNTQIHRNESF